MPVLPFYQPITLLHFGWYLSICLFIYLSILCPSLYLFYLSNKQGMKVDTINFKEIICLSFYRPSFKIYPVYLSAYLSIYPIVCPIMYLSMYLNLSLYLSPNPFNYLSISPLICIPLYPSVCLFIHLS